MNDPGSYAFPRSCNNVTRRVSPRATKIPSHDSEALTTDIFENLCQCGDRRRLHPSTTCVLKIPKLDRCETYTILECSGELFNRIARNV